MIDLREHEQDLLRRAVRDGSVEIEQGELTAALRLNQAALVHFDDATKTITATEQARVFSRRTVFA